MYTYSWWWIKIIIIIIIIITVIVLSKHFLRNRGLLEYIVYLGIKDCTIVDAVIDVHTLNQST